MNTPNSLEFSIGRSLVQSGAVSEETLAKAMAEARTSRDVLIGDILVSLGVSPEAMVKIFAENGFERADLSKPNVPTDVLRLIPESMARRYQVLPLALDGGTLVVATFNPYPQVEQILQVSTGHPIKFQVASPAEIMDNLEYHSKRILDFAKPLEAALTQAGNNAIAEIVRGGDASPVAQTVDLMLSHGIRMRASDVHIEPQPPYLRVRYRVDGVLQEGGKVPYRLATPITSRIRVLAGLDVMEQHNPQDGGFAFKDGQADGEEIDVRVSVLPTVHGAKVVMRLLDKKKTLLGLADLGFGAVQMATYKQIALAPHGMVLVAGPTGSGKSTTLYATIGEMDTLHANVITLEDPVEYKVTGVTQVQVNQKSGLTFAAGLRSILRQDPDIIILGEIRDRETADIAFRAAMTGHLVFATIHATDTLSSISRLADIGVEPYIISAALSGVVSQRLVRRNCPRCTIEVPLTAQERQFLQRLGVRDADTQKKGVGCNYCNHTGYRGREAAAEVLHVSDELKRLIARNANESDLQKVAESQGLLTLQAAALEKVRKNVTTVSEMMRAVYL